MKSHKHQKKKKTIVPFILSTDVWDADNICSENIKKVTSGGNKPDRLAEERREVTSVRRNDGHLQVAGSRTGSERAPTQGEGGPACLRRLDCKTRQTP